MFKEGWLAYAEALCYLDDMPLENGQAYLDELAENWPSMAEGLLAAH